MADDPFMAGLYVRAGEIGALTPGASRCGLDGFAVTAQTPPAGTRAPSGGVIGGGVSLRLATVTISLASR
jgi:hypothetical protein